MRATNLYLLDSIVTVLIIYHMLSESIGLKKIIVRLFSHVCLYLSVRGAGVTLQVTKVTGCVLQTEAGLVPLCHFTASVDLQ